MKNKVKKGPFARLVDFAKLHKGGYIASVIFAILGVASGMIPYFAMAQMIIRLVAGGKELFFYLMWGFITAIGFVLKIVFLKHIHSPFAQGNLFGPV